MCGRFAVTLPPEAMASLFDSLDRPNFAPNYNVAPTQKVPIIAIGKIGNRRIISARWGLFPDWLEQDPPTGPMFNARSETVDVKKSFKPAFTKRRCIIPADGFYEWQRDGKTRTPYYIYRKDKMPMAFAGLWEMKKSAQSEEILISATIITTQAAIEFAPIHERFPVILEQDSWSAWLSNETPVPRLKGLLYPPDNGVIAWHKVSDEVNKVANNHAGLMNAI